MGGKLLAAVKNGEAQVLTKEKLREADSCIQKDASAGVMWR